MHICNEPGAGLDASGAPGDASPSACMQHWLDGGASLRFIDPPQRLPLSSGFYSERHPWISPDGKTLYFGRTLAAYSGDLYVATRTSVMDDFTEATVTTMAMMNVNTQHDENRPALDAEERTLVFSSDRDSNPPDSHHEQIYITTRTDKNASFPAPTSETQRVLASINVNTPTTNYFDPFLSSNGQHLYVAPVADTGTQHLEVATMPPGSPSFGVPFPLTNLNSPSGECCPAVSPDERVIVFASDDDGDGSGENLWYATRQDPTGDFSPPRELSQLNTNNNEDDPVLSPDGCELYFASNAEGAPHLYRAKVVP